MNKKIIGLSLILAFIAFVAMHGMTNQQCSQENWFQKEFNASPAAVRSFSILTSNYSIICLSNRCNMAKCAENLNCCMVSNGIYAHQSLDTLVLAKSESQHQMLQYALDVSTNLSKVDAARFLTWFSQQTDFRR